MVCKYFRFKDEVKLDLCNGFHYWLLLFVAEIASLLKAVAESFRNWLTIDNAYQIPLDTLRPLAGFIIIYA